MILNYKNTSILNIENEIWVDVIGYEGHYMVSNLGRVKSLDRVIQHLYSGYSTLKGKILKQKVSKSGYCQLNLALNGKHKMAIVSRLVALAFIENIDNKKEVNHIDGNGLNNNVSNLEWVTPSENILHSYNVLNRAKHTHYKGEGNPNFKYYLDINNGIFYTKKDLCKLFLVKDRDLNVMYKNNHFLMKNLISV